MIVEQVLDELRSEYKRLKEERDAAIVEVGLLKQGLWPMKDAEIARWKDKYERLCR